MVSAIPERLAVFMLALVNQVLRTYAGFTDFGNFQPSNYSKCRNKIPTGMETQVFDEGLLQVPSKDLCAMQIYNMPQRRSILRFLFPISPDSASSALVE